MNEWFDGTANVYIRRRSHCLGVVNDFELDISQKYQQTLTVFDVMFGLLKMTPPPVARLMFGFSR
jgi:hypothetical protein